jgi:hypothetical protein
MNRTKSRVVVAVAGALMLGMAGSAAALEFYYTGAGNWTGVNTPDFPELSYNLPAGEACWGTGGRSCAYINLPNLANEPSDVNPVVWNELSRPTPDSIDIHGEVIVSNDIEIPVPGAPDPAPGDGEFPYAVMGYLTHDNVVINEFWDEPDGTDHQLELDYTLTIFAAEGGDQLFQLDETFVVEHWETENAGNVAPGECTSNPLTGTETPCPDRWRFALGEIGDAGLSFDAFIKEPVGTFPFDGHIYEVSITGFICSESLDCIGSFWTEEDGLRPPGVVAFEVHKVPAPSALALLGIGLVGLGMRRRLTA